MRKFADHFVMGALSLLLGACSPPDRDIRVALRDGKLIVDYPRSFWRLVGLQDRTFCLRRIQLFRGDRLIWMMTLTGDGQCSEVRMPLVLGEPLDFFIPAGSANIQPGVIYGVAIDGIGHGGAAFRVRNGEVENVGEVAESPCGQWWTCDFDDPHRRPRPRSAA